MINNAGFGVFGEFTETKLDHELDMIDTNIKAVHMLTKLFLIDMRKQNRGYILNVASSAAFLPGPLMASYYATKAYILNLTEAISEELKQNQSKVYIGTFCPGPVATEFNKVANVKFHVKSLDSKIAAEYAIKKMFQKKRIIIPTTLMKMTNIGTHLLPRKILLKICYHIQTRKDDRHEK